MHVTRPRSYRPYHSVHFEAVAELPSHVEPRTGPRHLDGSPTSYYGFVTCPLSGGLHSLDDCLHCGHFVNLRRHREPSEATLRCLCSHDDALADDRPVNSTWRMAPPGMPVAWARLLASVHGLSLLVVGEQDEVLGVVYLDRLDATDGTVGSCMVRPWCLPASSTLGDAVEVVRELHIPGVLVVGADDQLVGAVSTTDLRRLGVPAHLLR